MNNRPNLLSVCLITFNQVSFIEQAIESVLMQKVNFDYEFVIADDCSTDGTQEVLLKYCRKYPSLIKLIQQTANVGAAKNWADLLTYPKSKYIAYLEGDDYWTDPYKLQKQIDFLEGNLMYSVCFHSVKLELADGSIVDDYLTKEVPSTTAGIDLLVGNYIHSPSVVFRNIKLEEFFDVMDLSAPAGDYILHYHNAQNGLIYKFPEIMAVYRYGVGSWSSVLDFRMKTEREYLVNRAMFKLFTSHSALASKYYFSLVVAILIGIVKEKDIENDYERQLFQLLTPSGVAKHFRFSVLLHSLFLKIRYKLELLINL